ncbi:MULTISPECIES: hypothetical protein [unclassified Bradyrhizobium]|uniref:hypothetical protein n=1 Tax=unclassified Bradyrhizobium TaxID=2631580 RepID=UPI002479FB1C|nr:MULTISPECIES: hypothetical protein [unclassified Bradyrhizobium]WGS21082.1 hypothetical protein MTX22_04755 [Bradyrhizobium sp. ISRA463]WGS27999.1 hypothetical protein MTX19_02605 [Bradyrhizobium sp. ISRA464]
MNRRKTVMLAVAGMVSMITGSRRARAGSHFQEDGPMVMASGDDVPGLTNARSGSAAQLCDLKAVGPEAQVTAIQHLGDTFEVTTADGRKMAFREVDLRIKIDTGEKGPLIGKPVIMPGGMMDDRVTLFFASPAEVGTLVKYGS